MSPTALARPFPLRIRNLKHNKTSMETRLNEKYTDLCRRYHVSASIVLTNDASLPKQEICEKDGISVIKLNTAHIQDTDYEMHLAYNVGKILLPKLVLETDRLILRRFQPKDALDCFAFLSAEKDCYMDCSKPFTEMNDEYTERMDLFASRETQYMIVLKESGKVIGTVNVFDDDSRAVDAKEIGYAVSPSYQRKGYAYEALTALVDLLQNDLKFDLVVAGVLEENIASIRLLEKLGFQKEGLRHKAVWHEGLNRPVDLIYYYRDR